jgi:hypothetical protein
LAVLIPVELHVKDTGKFTVAGTGVTLKGKLDVRVDTTPFTGVSGSIKIKKGKAEFGS